MAKRIVLDRDFSAEVRARREALGLTQLELALRADVTEGCVSRLETLRSGPTEKVRQVLREALAAAEHEATLKWSA